jgi:hypothetical protein
MVQTERGTVTQRLKLGCQVKVELRLSILQAGFDLWCRHTAAYIKNTLHQSRQWRWRCEAYLIKPEARHVEAELDLPVRQGQRATPADLGLRQAYVQVR